jgi:hypothetical protein
MSLRHAISLLALALAITGVAHGAGTLSVAPAAVVGVRTTRVADLVLLGAGFDAGLRQGMVCRITRGNADIAEVLLVELRDHASAALILTLTPTQSVRAGDLATVKTFKT